MSRHVQHPHSIRRLHMPWHLGDLLTDFCPQVCKQWPLWSVGYWLCFLQNSRNHWSSYVKLIATKTHKTHSNQHEPLSPYPHVALPSPSMGRSAAPTTYDTAASYGPMLDKPGNVAAVYAWGAMSPWLDCHQDNSETMLITIVRPFLMNLLAKVEEVDHGWADGSGAARESRSWHGWIVTLPKRWYSSYIFLL